jgi:hypothetical protein
MVKNKNFFKLFCVAAICAGLTACGGGGSGGSDPVAQATTPGPGSTTPSAEVTGKIQYTHYQATTKVMGEATFATVAADSTFNSTTKQGSITFPVLGGTETVSTSDGYATTTWAGPFTSGAYRLNGNILMGCNAASPTENQATNVFVSSSLARLKDGAIDDLNGKSFDLIDCGIIKQAAAQTLTVNADGSLFLSTANYTFPKNEVFGMLNPERFPPALINGPDPKTKGFYAGHAFRYTNNGVTKYAIIMQTSANSFNDANNFHYLVAIQR